jgi:thioredoxin-related protein
MAFIRRQRLLTGLLFVLACALQAPSQVLAQNGPRPDGSPVVWPSFEQALAAAAESRRVLLIDVYSPNCPWCRKLQTEIYTNPDLQRYVYENFEIGRLDISVDTDTINFKGYQLSSAQLGAGFGASGTPTTIFLEPNGDYITRLPGFHELDEFTDVLHFMGSQSFRRMSFPDYVDAKQ